MKNKIIVDGNQACANIAYLMSDLEVIYPITPSSPMAEACDEWACAKRKNLFGNVGQVVEMQSEAGVAGAMHGALCGGALTTTFTSSQGLLLMLPNMFKISGELLPAVIHVSARSLSTHALNIFGDHSDVMAVRSSGFAMLNSTNPNEAQYMALASHLASLKSSVPFLHFFDGFRTSHELNVVDKLNEEDLKSILPLNEINNFRNYALNSQNPHQQGTAQNPDVFFQNREACEKYYQAVPQIVENVFEQINKKFNKNFKLFEYYGPQNPENLILTMGSSFQTIKQVANENTGVILVRLYRPFAVEYFIKAVPNSVKKIIVLDRVKESGSLGEPLFQDVCTALQNSNIQIVGGRYGLGGKEFTPAMANAVIKNFEQMKNNFTVGINDDVLNSSLKVEEHTFPAQNCFEARFYGLGSDGTVSAIKNSIKIIGENSELFVQGYFEYDSKKSGSLTISHLRVCEDEIHSPYLTNNLDFVGCHNSTYIMRYNILDKIKPQATLLINMADDFNFPNNFKKELAVKQIKVFAIDGFKIANECGLKGKISTIMQCAFFKLANILPIEKIKDNLIEYINKTFKFKGDSVIQANIKSLEMALTSIKEIKILPEWKNLKEEPQQINNFNNEFYSKIMEPILNLKGNDLPVSAFDVRGFMPTATSQFEKRGIANELPEWIKEKCIACGKCAMACPHACINAKMIDEKYNLIVNPLDCTGCGNCANICPVKAIAMKNANEILNKTKEIYEQTKNHENKETKFLNTTVKGNALTKNYFEFSGACAGCGETPYIKLLTSLFGDKMIIANATGCSSIYGGSFPSCPYAKNDNGEGPAWASSLFEDNAEFGYGIKLAKNILQKKESVWIVGGDGWAFDIGFGGLDHILCSNEKIRVLVLNSEVYSNTGGQASKATNISAVAKFTANGKKTNKKNFPLLAVQYQNCYVASISLGANEQQAINAFMEAEQFDGPSIIFAYCPCINHGIDMSKSTLHMKDATKCGYYPIFRYNPNENSLQIDCEPNFDLFMNFIMSEKRYSSLKLRNPNECEQLFESAKQKAISNFEMLKLLAKK